MIFALYSIRGDIMIAIPRTIEPEVCTYLDDQRSCLIIETVLPGVHSLDILLKVNSRCMIISAVTGTITYQKYLAFILIRQWYTGYITHIFFIEAWYTNISK